MQHLTEAQVYFLKIFTSYKPFARRENFVREQGRNGVQESYETLEAELLAAKVLKQDKAGRVSLKQTWDETLALMSAQSDSVEALSAKVKVAKEAICAAQAKIALINATNPVWPSNDYMAREQAREQITYLNKNLENLAMRLSLSSKAGA